MSEVFDLDAVAAENDEREPFRFKFDGNEYEMAPNFDLLALAAITEGNLGAGLRIMLGDEQFQRMVQSRATMDETRFKALLEAYAAHIGSTLGESSASTGSLKSTEGPSKPTSNGSTKSLSPISS